MGKIDVLAQLRDGEYISGEEMSQRLGISRAAVWKSIKALRSEGYTIDSAQNRGYCLRLVQTQLQMSRIQLLLGGCPWAQTVFLYDEVDSTNNSAKRAAADGAPHGAVFVAARQTGGRGRLGRQFASPAGGVYLTVLLRPQAEAAKLMHLTAAAAVAVRRAIADCSGVQTQIKWMNDLLIENKKVCGILTEISTVDSGQLDYAIIGIGINCNTAVQSLPQDVRNRAASLRETAGKIIDPNVLAAKLIGRLYEMDLTLQQRQAWLSEYAAACVTVGREVIVQHGEDRRRARATGIGEDGGLVVTYDDATTAVVNYGEVLVRGIDGYV